MEESQVGRGRKSAAGITGSLSPSQVEHLHTLLSDALLWLREPNAPSALRADDYWVERHKLIVAIEMELCDLSHRTSHYWQGVSEMHDAAFHAAKAQGADERVLRAIANAAVKP